MIDVLDRRQEALVLLAAEGREEAAIGDEPFEQRGSGQELGNERRGGRTGLGGEGSGCFGVLHAGEFNLGPPLEVPEILQSWSETPSHPRTVRATRSAAGGSRLVSTMRS